MSNSIKIYTADECDAKYLQHNDSIDGTYLISDLSLSGTTLTIERLDPTADWSMDSITLTLPSGGEPAAYCNSIAVLTTGAINYYNTSGGVQSGTKAQFQYSYMTYYSWTTASITTSTTSSSWTKLGSFSKSSTYLEQRVQVKFKSSGDYGGVMITTQSSSPSETNSGVIGIMTLPSNRWGTFSLTNDSTSTYYIYGMSVTNVEVKYKNISRTTANCTAKLSSISSGGGSL